MLHVGSKVFDLTTGLKIDDTRLSAGWFGMLKVPSLAFIGQFNSWVREPPASTVASDP